MQAVPDLSRLDAHMAANVRQRGRSGVRYFLLREDGAENLILQIFVGGQCVEKHIQHRFLIILGNITLDISGTAKNPRNAKKLLWLQAAAPIRTLQGSRHIAYIPENGIILEKAEYVLRENDTVYDILDRILRYNKIMYERRGSSDSSVYIVGINYLYEYSCGPLSGWMYSVNGVFSDKSCTEYVLSDGDVIEWVYSCDLGKDVGKKGGQ